MATAFKTSVSVTTELGRINQLAATLGVNSFPAYRQATLNYKYDVLNSYSPQEIPRIRYFGIGIGGFANVSTEKNIAQPYIPSPENMDLYTPIPFRCVPEPLDQDEAAKYRIIQKKQIGDTWYFLYWLKLLKFDDIAITKVAGDNVGTGSLDTANLYPVPTALASGDVDENTARISASVTAIREIEGKEALEAINVMYDGDLRRARISEFGLYSGVEVPQQYSAGEDWDYPYTEAGYVQLASHMCCIGYDKSNSNTTIKERCVISTGELVQL